MSWTELFANAAPRGCPKTKYMKDLASIYCAKNKFDHNMLMPDIKKAEFSDSLPYSNTRSFSARLPSGTLLIIFSFYKELDLKAPRLIKNSVLNLLGLQNSVAYKQPGLQAFPLINCSAYKLFSL